MDQGAIKEIQLATAIREVNAFGFLPEGVIALPDDFSMHSLEGFQPLRNRARGKFSTTDPDSFCTYVTQAGTGTVPCYLSKNDMTAQAILNAGTVEHPGHCDDTASLIGEKSAAYRALVQVATAPLTQREWIEWLTDWAPHITADDTDIKRVIAAYSHLTIESAKKLENKISDLAESRSMVEDIAAKSKHGLASRLAFQCTPYEGLNDREFTLRVAIHLGEKIKIGVRIEQHEHLKHQMAEEFGYLIRAKFSETNIRIYLGHYETRR